MFTVNLPGIDGTIWWPGILLMGLIIGTLTGLFGVGGGFLLTPCLNIIFAVHYTYAVASGLALFFVTCSMSAYRHYKKNNVDLKLGTIMGLSAMAGSMGGKRIMDYLSKDAGTIELLGHQHQLLDMVMNGLFVILLIAVMVSVLREAMSKKNAGEEEAQTELSKTIQGISIPPCLSFHRAGIESMSLWAPVVISLAVGVVTGLMGVGGGFILLPLLVYVIGIPTTCAVGTSSFQILFATFFSSIIYILDVKGPEAPEGGEAMLLGLPTGFVSFHLTGLLLIGSLIGVQIGVHLSSVLGGRSIRKYFSLVIALSLVIVLYKIGSDLAYGPKELDEPHREAPAEPGDRDQHTEAPGAEGGGATEAATPAPAAPAPVSAPPALPVAGPAPEAAPSKTP